MDIAKSSQLPWKMHVKACQLLAKEMQHLCWNVLSSHCTLKINITEYDTECSKSRTDSSFLKICKIRQSSTAKESEVPKHTYIFNRDTSANLLSVLKTVLGFLLAMSSSCASLLGGEVSTQLGRLSAGSLSGHISHCTSSPCLPTGIQPVGDLPSLSCSMSFLKNLWWKRWGTNALLIKELKSNCPLGLGGWGCTGIPPTP